MAKNEVVTDKKYEREPEREENEQYPLRYCDGVANVGTPFWFAE